MAATCSVCGDNLGIRRRIAGTTLCATHEAAALVERDLATKAGEAAATEYLAAATAIGADPTALSRLSALSQSAALGEADLKALNIRALADAVAVVLSDAHLSEYEERRLDNLVRGLGLTEGDVKHAVGSRANELLIARINAGRLPVVADHAIFLKTGEVMHLQVEAALLKEVVQRETRGGYSGFSVPIAKGIRYRVGGYRGRSVVVGTSLQVADKGMLCLSSQRAVFKGARTSVECLFAKLVGINVFDDGIQFHVSNRKTATLVRVGDGHLAGAVVNAIVGRQS